MSANMENSSGHRTRKSQCLFQCQRKAMPTNVQTTALLHSSHMLAQSYAQNSPNQSLIVQLPDIQAGFKKGRGTRVQIANIHWIIEKAREF